MLRSLFFGDGSVKRGGIIACPVLIEPELGQMTWSEAEARDRGRAIKVQHREMTKRSKACEMGKTAGLMEVVLDVNVDEILGAVVLGTKDAEIVQLLVELMNAGGTGRTMLKAVHIHPNLTEAAKHQGRALGA